MSSDEKPDRKRGPGRPPRYGPRELEIIEQVVRDHPTASMPELLDLVEEGTGVRAGRETLRKAMRKLGVQNVGRDARRRRGKRSAKPTGPKPEETFRYLRRHREESPTARHKLGVSDAEWEVVEDIFVDKERGVPRKYDRRDMLDAMLYVLRGGIPWRALPSEYPPWNQVYKTFRRWSRQGRFKAAMTRVRRLLRVEEGRDAEPTGANIDTQTVATSAQGGPKGFDAHKHTKGRKRHLITDTLGLLLAVVVHAANLQDRDMAERVVSAARADVPTIQRIYADGGYAGRSRRVIEAKHENLRVKIVRPADNRSVGYRVPAGEAHLFPEWAEAQATGFKVLPKRWVIERTNGWHLRDRRLTRDQDRRLDVAESWVWMSSMKRGLAALTHPT